MMVWDDLIAESQRLEERASKIQDGETIGLSQEEIATLAHEYQVWLGKCLSVLPDDMKEKFRAEYEGTFWNVKIKRFFEAATEPSPFRPTDEATKQLFPYWSCPFKHIFLPYIRSQRQLLIEASERPLPSESTAEDEAWNKTVRRIFKVFIEKANTAQTTHEKKLTYEYLAMFLIGSIEGLTIVGHDERGVSEEIDLWVANDSEHIFWKKLPHAFIVECKNWGTPVGVPELRTLRAIMNDKNIQLALLLAKNGITGDKNHDAGDIIRNAFRDNKFILVLTEADLLEIANGVSPTEKIRKKYLDLLMKS